MNSIQVCKCAIKLLYKLSYWHAEVLNGSFHGNKALTGLLFSEVIIVFNCKPFQILVQFKKRKKKGKNIPTLITSVFKEEQMKLPLTLKRIELSKELRWLKSPTLITMQLLTWKSWLFCIGTFPLFFKRKWKTNSFGLSLKRGLQTKIVYALSSWLLWRYSLSLCMYPSGSVNPCSDASQSGLLNFYFFS